MVPPEKVVALGTGADRGRARTGRSMPTAMSRHGFTNPKAHEIGIDGVRYNALAAERSWTSFINLLEELFG